MTIGSWACGCCYLLFIYRPVMLYVLLYIPRLKAVCLCCVGVGPEAEQADLQHARPRWLCNWTQPELWGIIPSLKLHGQHGWGVYVNESMRNDSSRVIMLFLLSLCFFFFKYLCASVVRIWDVRPFAPKERCVKIFQGNVHNFEKVTKITLWPSL